MSYAFVSPLPVSLREAITTIVWAQTSWWILKNCREKLNRKGEAIYPPVGDPSSVDLLPTVLKTHTAIEGIVLDYRNDLELTAPSLKTMTVAFPNYKYQWSIYDTLGELLEAHFMDIL